MMCVEQGSGGEIVLVRCLSVIVHTWFMMIVCGITDARRQLNVIK